MSFATPPQPSPVTLLNAFVLVGGSVLQIKDIPTRPTKYDGLLCLGGVPKGINEAKIKEVLQRFGEIEVCIASEQSDSQYRVKFTEHAAAEQTVAEAPKVEGVYDYAFIAYNSRPYDDLDTGGEGRGW